MLHASKRQRGVTLDRWLLRGPSDRAMLLTNPTVSQSAKTAGVKAERNRRYENKECFVCVKQGISNGTTPKASRARRGKAFMA